VSFLSTNRLFKIGGYDVSAWVLSLIDATGIYNKPEWGGMPAAPRIQFKVVNDNNQFSSFSDVSLLYNKKVQDLTLKMLYQQGTSEILEWDGYIENIVENLTTNIIEIFGVSKFQQNLDLPALISTSIDTPATLSKEIFQLYDIPVNESSFNRADSLLSGLVTVQVDPNLVDSNINLYELQKLLAVAGYARIYINNGEMHYEVYDSTPPTITIALTDKDLMTDPQISLEESQFKAYKVEYLDGTIDSSGFVDGETPQQSLNFGLNSPVKITSQSAALQVGDQWEAISLLDKKRITFGVKHELGYILSLDSFVSLTVTDIGIEDNLEIIAIDRTDDKYIMITGRTI
jgi:hypothetical protein